MSPSTKENTCGFCDTNNAPDATACVTCGSPFSLAAVATPRDLPSQRRPAPDLPDALKAQTWRKVNVFLCVPCGTLLPTAKRRRCPVCKNIALFAVVFVEPPLTTALPESIPIMEEPTTTPAVRGRWRAAVDAFFAELRR